VSRRPEVILKDGSAVIDGKPFPLASHELTKIIGSGANGVVFKANNRLLQRVEAVKLWLPGDSDGRDKVKQGMLETQKQAAEIHPQVVKILYADVIDGTFYSTMDYFEGGSLKNWIVDADSTLKWGAAAAYLRLIEETSKPELYHGDPHAGNVLIDEYGNLALCDYGTSYYNITQGSWERHWKIVDQVMRKLLSHFATFDLCRAEYSAMYPKNTFQEMIADYHSVFDALSGEVYMFTDGIERLHEDQQKILRPLLESGKKADGTDAHDFSEIRPIIQRRRRT
jgi:serine/threonine protein kinase